MASSADNVILAGPARSGTTLACRLLNLFPEVVALDEPFARSAMQAMEGPADLLADVARQFDEQRRMIETEGEARSTIAAGGDLGNHYADQFSTDIPRARQVVLDKIRVDALPSFRLVIKHTLPFTAIIDDLSNRYPTFVLVRNPLAILASWNTIDAAYREGAIQSYAERLTGDLASRLGDITDRLDRKIDLLRWHFERYLPALRRGSVIRYEDIVETGGNVLGTIASASPGTSRRLDQDLRSHNTNPLYDREVILRLKDRLLAAQGAFWDFYRPVDIERLAHDFSHGIPALAER